jgi:hypothetical protein
MKLKAQELQTIVNATLENYNRRAEEFWAGKRDTMSLKKQQRQFSGALAGTAHAQDFDLLPHSSQGWRSRCV